MTQYLEINEMERLVAQARRLINVKAAQLVVACANEGYHITHTSARFIVKRNSRLRLEQGIETDTHFQFKWGLEEGWAFRDGNTYEAKFFTSQKLREEYVKSYQANPPKVDE